MIENTEFDEYGISPLFDAAIHNDAIKADEILKRKPSLLEKTNRFGETVLMLAVAFESYSVIRVILEHLDMKYGNDTDAISAFLNLRSRQHCTALIGIDDLFNRIYKIAREDLNLPVKFPTDEQQEVDFTKKVDAYTELMKRGAIIFDEEMSDNGINIIKPCYLMTRFHWKSKLLGHAFAVYVMSQSENPLPNKTLAILDHLVKQRFINGDLRLKLELILYYEKKCLQLRSLLEEPTSSISSLIITLSWLFVSRSTEVNVYHISCELERLAKSSNSNQNLLRFCAALYAFHQIPICREIIENIAEEFLQITAKLKVDQIYDAPIKQVILMSMAGIFTKFEECSADKKHYIDTFFCYEGIEDFVTDYNSQLEQLIEEEVDSNLVNEVTQKMILLDALKSEKFVSNPRALIECFELAGFPYALVPSKYHEQLIQLASEYVLLARPDTDGILPCINVVLEKEALFNDEKISQLKDFNRYVDCYYKLLNNNPKLSWQGDVFDVFKRILKHDYLSNIDNCVLSICVYIAILGQLSVIENLAYHLEKIPFFNDIQEEIILMVQLRQNVANPKQADDKNIESNLNRIAGSDTATARLIACLKLRLAILKLHHHPSYHAFKEKIDTLEDPSSFFLKFNSIKTAMDQVIIAYEANQEFIWRDCYRNQWQDYYNQCLASIEIGFITEFTLGLEVKLMQLSNQSNVDSTANTNQIGFFSSLQSHDDHPSQQTGFQANMIKR